MRATANKHVLPDVEDERLTAGERHQLRQIALRLQAGSTAQPVVRGTARPRYETNSLEAAIDEIFGEAKTRVSDN